MSDLLRAWERLLSSLGPAKLRFVRFIVASALASAIAAAVANLGLLELGQLETAIIAAFLAAASKWLRENFSDVPGLPF